MTRIIFAAILLSIPVFVNAQIPVVVSERPVRIEDPTEFTAYYAVLNNAPDLYTISAADPFPLTLSLLVPDTEESKLDVSLAVIQDGATATPLTVFDAGTARWELAYDEGAENFFRRHSTFHSVVPAGEYEIRVWSSANDSKYIFEVGNSRKEFSLNEIKKRYVALPTIKRDFYGKPSWEAYLSPALVGPVFLVLLVLVLGLMLTYLWRNR